MEEITFISAAEIFKYIVSYTALRIWGHRWSYVETGGSCPDAVASGADDGGLVDVAGANEAGNMSVSWTNNHMIFVVAVVPRVDVSC